MGNQTSADDMNMARHKFDDDPKKNVKNFPNRTGRATYDALTGFPQGRKERGMMAVKSVCNFLASFNLTKIILT